MLIKWICKNEGGYFSTRYKYVRLARQFVRGVLRVIPRITLLALSFCLPLLFLSCQKSNPISTNGFLAQPGPILFTINVEGSALRRITGQTEESITSENFHNWTVTGWTYSPQGSGLLVGDLRYLAEANHQPADTIVAFGLDGKESRRTL